MPSDPTLLAAKLIAAKAAAKAVTNGWTYAGFNVGSRVSEDEFDQLAVAMVNAVDDVENSNVIPLKGKK